MDNFSREIEVAVNWWAEQLGALPNAEQTSLDGEMGLMVDIAIAMRFDDDPVLIPASQRDAFKVALAEILAKALADRPFGLTVRVDYDPDAYLAEALEKAGIVEPPLSFKTVCHIYKGEVSVRVGNSASTSPIYQAKDT